MRYSRSLGWTIWINARRRHHHLRQRGALNLQRASSLPAQVMLQSTNTAPTAPGTDDTTHTVNLLSRGSAHWSQVIYSLPHLCRPTGAGLSSSSNQSMWHASKRARTATSYYIQVNRVPCALYLIFGYSTAHLEAARWFVVHSGAGSDSVQSPHAPHRAARAGTRRPYVLLVS